MKNFRFLFINLCLSLLLISSCSDDVINGPHPISTIAFGSCANVFTYNDKMDVFQTVLDQDPDLYIGMGDNMYADVPFLVDLPFYKSFIELQYNLLSNDPYFKKLKKTVPLIATWDDHDYGLNNGGKDFPHKIASKKAFMQFWNVAEDAGMRNREGIYDVYSYGEGEKKLQIILLDTRWNLDIISSEPISPTSDITKNILGEEQWAWLEEKLLEPAAIRIIGSSTQFGIEENGFEAWANYPHEMERMFKLIQNTKAEGVFFISGDIHYSEVSKREAEGLYPIYDFTASGMTHNDGPRPNKFRVGDSYHEYNFGLLSVNWDTEPITIEFQIVNKAGEVVISQVTNLNELSF